MNRPRRSLRTRRTRGFSLVELLVVMVVIVLVAVLAVPEARRMMLRSQLVGSAHQIANVFQVARLRAIRSSQQTVVRLDLAAREVKAFVDVNGDKTFDAGDTELVTLGLPRAVSLAAPGGQPVADNFEGADPQWIAVFQPQGIAERAGAFRVAVLAGGLFENYLEVRIQPPLAMGRVQIRKWETTAWRTSGEGDQAWHWY